MGERQRNEKKTKHDCNSSHSVAIAKFTLGVREVPGSNPGAPTTFDFFPIWFPTFARSILNTIACSSLSGGSKKRISVRYRMPSGNRAV